MVEGSEFVVILSPESFRVVRVTEADTGNLDLLKVGPVRGSWFTLNRKLVVLRETSSTDTMVAEAFYNIVRVS